MRKHNYLRYRRILRLTKAVLTILLLALLVFAKIKAL